MYWQHNPLAHGFLILIILTMQSGRIVLPAPNFDTTKNKPNNQSSFDIVKSQTKCLSKHKLFPIYPDMKSNKSVPNNNSSKCWKNKGYTQKNNSKETWCDTCDRGFRTLDELNKHKQEHRKCGIDGCKFTAHPSVVSKHIQQQHASGLFDKIQKLSTPEEIDKWREERKKHYPTKENVELRRKAQEERFKRGEKLEDPKNRFSKKQDRRQIRNYDVKRNQRQHQQSQEFRKDRKHLGKRNSFKTKENVSTVKEKQIEENRKNDGKIIEKLEVEDKIKKVENKIADNDDDDNNCRIPRFGGTNNLEDYKKCQPKQKTQNILSSLLGMYGSSDDESGSDQELCDSEPGNNLDHKIFASVNESINQQIDVKLGEDITAGESSTQQEKVPNDVPELFNSENEVEEQQLVQQEVDLKEIKLLQNDKRPFLKAFKQEQEEIPCKKVKSVDEVKESLNLESDDEMPEEVPIVKVKEDISDNTTELSSNPVLHNKSKSRPQDRKDHTDKNKTRKTLLNYSKLRKQRPNTLLEKLLQPSIRHERNLLLQCVRFVVKNEFFGIGANQK